MALAHLSGKIHWLEASSNRASRSAVESRAKSAISNLRTTSLAPAIKSMLVMDLCHVVLRNRFWLAAPIFTELLVEYLSDDYQIPRDAAIDLAEDVVHGAQNIRDSKSRLDIRDWISHYGLRDKEFLRYVFVSTATATCEDQLVMTLGLGTRLLRRIKAAAESAITQSTASHRTETDRATMIFVPEIDALFAEIMSDLSREVRQNPWAMDIHRLRFHLLQSANSAESEQPPNMELATTIFEFLMTLGKARTLTEDTLDIKVLELSLAADLVFVADCSNRFGKSMRAIALTPFGEELTAGPFAMELLPRVCQSGKLDHDLILSLPACYQQSVIRSLHGASRHFLPDLLDTYLDYLGDGLEVHTGSHNSAKKTKTQKPIMNLSPGSLEASLKQLVPLIDNKEVDALIERLLCNTKPTWIRLATCAALSASQNPHYIRQVLTKVTDCDSSAKVRDVAHESLNHLESQ